MFKNKVIIPAIFTLLFIGGVSAQQINKPEQQLFYYGKLAMVSVDRQLFVSDTSDYFYIHVTVKNISGNALGIDLTNPWHVLYPNQWQFSDTTFRVVIDETQIVPEVLDAKKASDMAMKIKDNKLTMVLPMQSFDYYTEFNAEKPNANATNHGRYLIVAIDGQMFFTDGSNIEQVKCNGDLNVDRELVFTWPVTWLPVPDKHKIHHRR